MISVGAPLGTGTQVDTQVTRQFLQIVNDLRHEQNVKPMSETTALKFLMARKFDLNRSLALYKAHELARCREGLTDFDPNKEPLKSELESGKFTVLVSFILPNRNVFVSSFLRRLSTYLLRSTIRYYS